MYLMLQLKLISKFITILLKHRCKKLIKSIDFKNLQKKDRSGILKFYINIISPLLNIYYIFL